MSIIQKAVDKIESESTSKIELDKNQSFRHKRKSPWVNSKNSLSQVNTKVADHLSSLNIDNIIDIDQYNPYKDNLNNDSETVTRSINEFSSLKRPLLQNIKQASIYENADANIKNKTSEANIIMVTSAESGEGKTFASINLAKNIARSSENHVVLIDADTVKKDLTEIFELKNRKGLTDVIEGKYSSPEEVINNTNLKNLQIIGAGLSEDADAELLSGDKMKQFLKFLLGPLQRSKVIIIFDSPPISLSSEAQFLASIVGQVLLVVKAGKTSTGKVKRCTEYLDNTKPIGMVLNWASKDENTGYYTAN